MKISPAGEPPFAIHRKVLLDALSGVESAFRGRLLDVGCNDKPYQKHFGHRCTDWVGLDLPRYAGGETRADLFSAAGRLAVEGSSFDTILCTQVLDDLARPGEFFAEAFRVLRSGGQLIVSAPQYSVPHNEPHDFFRFSRHALHYLAEEAGFVVMEMRPQGGAAALIGFVVSAHLPALRWRNWLGRALQRLIDRFFLSLDRRWFRPKDTMGWVMVCRKSSDPRLEVIR